MRKSRRRRITAVMRYVLLTGWAIIASRMRVSEAIGTVGGLTLFADDDELFLIRGSDKTQVVKVDFDAIQSGDLRTNVQVYGGDIIYVSPTVLAKIGYGIQQVLFPFTPFFGLASTAARF